MNSFRLRITVSLLLVNGYCLAQISYPFHVPDGQQFLQS